MWKSLLLLLLIFFACDPPKEQIPVDDVGVDPGEETDSALSTEFLATLARLTDYPNLAASFRRMEVLADAILSPEKIEAVKKIVDIFAANPSPDYQIFAEWLAYKPQSPEISFDRNITVDGNSEDWGNDGIVSLDPAGDAEPYLDITEVRMKLDPNGFYFLVTFNGSVTRNTCFAFVSDSRLGAGFDYEGSMGYYQGAWGYLFTFDDQGEYTQTWVPGVQVKTRDNILEAFFPFQFQAEKAVTPFYFFATDFEDLEKFDNSKPYPYIPAETDGALPLLYELALSRDIAKDPDTALSIATTEKILAENSETGVYPLILEHLRDLFDFSQELDTWQTAQNLPVRYQDLSLWQKLFWTWRAEENSLYGTFKLSANYYLMTEAVYRFNAFSAENLRQIQALIQAHSLIIPGSLNDTAVQIDAWIWAHLKYRSYPDAMAGMCANGWVSQEICDVYEVEKENLEQVIGDIAGKPIYYWDALSVDFQLQYYAEHGEFIGDCGTATTLSAAFYKAIGLAATGFQYFAKSFDIGPTHNFPFYYDPKVATWYSPQNNDFHEESFFQNMALSYFLLPPRDFPKFLTGYYDEDWTRHGGMLYPLDLTYEGIYQISTLGYSAEEINRLLLSY